MSELEDLAFDPGKFSGQARLFPLPNLVMFPHVLQPLHIFEPRYRALLAEALSDDQLIAMMLLAPGWEKNYEGRPVVHPVGCLTRIASHQKQPDERSNVLLLGLCRVRVVRELAPRQSFREAEVEILDDIYPASGAANRVELQHSLVKAFQTALPQLDVSDQLEQLLGSNLPLGVLTDIVSYSLDLGTAEKQALLAEQNVDRRAAALIAHLLATTPESMPAGPVGFPPQFSLN